MQAKALDRDARTCQFDRHRVTNPSSYSSCSLQPRVLCAKECMHVTRYRHGESIAVHVRSTCRRFAYVLPARIVIYFLCYRVSASRRHDVVLRRL